VVFLDRIIRLVSKFSDQIAQIGVFAMFLLVAGNIVIRMVWKPFFGTYDYVCFIAAIVVSFALANCAVQKGHTQVELLVARFSQRAQGIIGSITGILSLGIFSLVTWQCIVLANEMRRVGAVTMTGLFIFYPYIYAVAFGVALLCVVIIIDIINSIGKAVKG
jgi:TRAP-type C4-dicarboxylate transport system permease small subunit